MEKKVRGLISAKHVLIILIHLEWRGSFRFLRSVLLPIEYFDSFVGCKCHHREP